jgi:hypothetical protein
MALAIIIGLPVKDSGLFDPNGLLGPYAMWLYGLSVPVGLVIGVGFSIIVSPKRVTIEPE